MKVKQAKELAREWVYLEAQKIDGFEGALFHGSVIDLPDNDKLPSSSDVDVLVILTHVQQPSPGKFLYRDVLLEVSYLPVEEIQSADKILSTYYLAESFRKPGLILDPSGRLSKLHEIVAEKFAENYWVQQRCLGAQDRSLKYLNGLHAADAIHDQVTGWLFARGVMAHILLVAGLKNPTVRKRYATVKQLLLTHHLDDFYEELLALSGFAHLHVRDVERQLAALTELFDIASSVLKTPYRFAPDISHTARAVVIDGSVEMINAGLHREAMFWIVASFCRCQHVLSYDAAPKIREKYNKPFTDLLSLLNIVSFEERQRSNEMAKDFLPKVWTVAQRIMNDKS